MLNLLSTIFFIFPQNTHTQPVASLAKIQGFPFAQVQVYARQNGLFSSLFLPPFVRGFMLWWMCRNAKQKSIQKEASVWGGFVLKKKKEREAGMTYRLIKELQSAFLLDIFRHQWFGGGRSNGPGSVTQIQTKIGTADSPNTGMEIILIVHTT